MAARQRSRIVRDLEKSRQSDAGTRRGQVVRPKLDRTIMGHCRGEHKGSRRSSAKSGYRKALATIGPPLLPH